MKYVIAGNYDQYQKWTYETHRDRNEYVYVAVVANLIGLRDIHGYFVGTWYERRDIQEILKYISAANNEPIPNDVMNMIPKWIKDGWL
jgi:hypothetical protein